MCGDCVYNVIYYYVGVWKYKYFYRNFKNLFFDSNYIIVYKI